MSIIRDLKLDENGWFAEGKFDSKSLFQGEMKISSPACRLDAVDKKLQILRGICYEEI